MSKELLRLEPVFQEKSGAETGCGLCSTMTFPVTTPENAGPSAAIPAGIAVKNPEFAGETLGSLWKKGRTCLVTCRGTASLCW